MADPNFLSSPNFRSGAKKRVFGPVQNEDFGPEKNGPEKKFREKNFLTRNEFEIKSSIFSLDEILKQKKFFEPSDEK